MADERETKLEAHASFDVPDLVGVLPDAVVARHGPIDLRAVYFDTADFRLIRAGVTLRHRAEPGFSGWQLKLPGRDPDGDGLTRLELAFRGGRTRAPETVRSQVRAYTRDAPLQPVARLRTRRTVTTLSGDDGPLLEVADDEVSVYHGRRLATRFRELEVELLDAGDDDHRAAVVDALVAAGAARAAQEPKLLRALGPQAREAPDIDVPKPGKPDPDRPVGPVIAQALLVDLERMVRHEPGTRRGDDAEELHQMRVATRRLRSTLKIYGPLLDADWADDLRARLQGVAAALGEVRDLDVQLAALEDDADTLGERESLAPLTRHLQDRRTAARTRLLATLDGRDHVALLEQLVADARAPKVLEPDQPAGPALAPLVRKAWRKVSKGVDEHIPLHEVRIKAKRLRYAAEAAVPAFGKDAAQLADAAADVQGLLGDHQDAVVAEETARAYLADHPDAPAPTVFALGLLAGLSRERRRELEAEWPDAWDDLSRKKLRRFLQDA